ncbi:PREDICTED: sentrin-specific protease 8-like [Polistes dominula]|uniref:Sentrin-specific protease 8-like n=1 Tax=Polistes dominula TaxID=743375 RepID=A0ABM1HXZ6_POLDO|nr:PREDICTED: sentrin-specific protease 8-like [Polistes dominula]XP_015172833.1 PREDICTED: sentrin-specific protease 8-like [Polistes dominula]
MAYKNPNEIVLSYQDSLLRNSDVELLKGQHWLNDTIIGFYLEYLYDHLNVSDKNKILYISPELTQLLKMTELSQYDIFLEPINAHSKEFIFFPLNNMSKKDAAGGSHWSLLVYSKPENTYFHFDSCQGTNGSIASTFTNNLMLYFNCTNDTRFIERDCPQQDNGFDCGLYVLCFIEIISQYILQNDIIRYCKLDIIDNYVRFKREELLLLITSMKRKQEQQSYGAEEIPHA